jgi:manganese transport protein
MATAAFYLLGAGVLHPRGTVPAAKDMIPVLSQIYTGTLGPWALWPFYAGAVVTLYGTIFACVAAHSRIFADMCRLMGRFARDDYEARVRYRRGFVVALSTTAAAAFLVVESPVRMVVFGGVAQCLMLPIVGAGTLYLRYWRLPAGIAPNAFVTASLWGCTLVMLAVAVYYLVSV